MHKNSWSNNYQRWDTAKAIFFGLLTHKTRETCFTLVVGNFAIKFTKMEDAKHLIEALKKITQSQSIGEQENTLDSPLIGITTRDKYMCACQVVQTKLS